LVQVCHHDGDPDPDVTIPLVVPPNQDATRRPFDSAIVEA